ncbi:MAG: protein-glutamate methylesterase/protein-glutamine glutaminase [Ferrovibrionaceae bacterium]
MATDGPYRVMLVDDSAVVRGLVTRWMQEDPEIEVVASVGNGAVAVREIGRTDIEVIVLDVEMPEMDGLTALPKILAAQPDVKVIMASTLTMRNADISLKALQAGAADYIAKPSAMRDQSTVQEFQRDLLARVKTLGAVGRRAARRRAGLPEGGSTAKAQPAPNAAPAASRPGTAGASAGVAAGAAAPTTSKSLYAGPIVLRNAAILPPKVLAIGSSTGGPQALFQVFGQLKNKIRIPILITQHMPPTFTTILAEHLTRIAGANASEAVDGEPVEGGRIYIAPGNWHMTVQVDAGNKKIIRLNQDPPENFCRPAVDPMLRSLAKAYGGSVLAVILTGMGADGMKGGQVLTEAGGTMIAQDEATSVVWGMPGAVASHGLCSAVLPLDRIASHIEKLTQGAVP